MRILATSDWHLDAVTLGRPRLVELVAYLKQLRKEVRDQEIDAVVFGGDAADPGSMMGPLYEALTIEWFWELASATRGGVLVGIAGNHDVVEVSEPLSTLTPARQALRPRLGRASIHVPDAPIAVIEERPALVELPKHNVAFLLLPYVARAWADAEARGERTVDGPEYLMDLAFRSAAELQQQRGTKIVVVGHRNVPGAALGNESAELARGRDVDLPIDRIAALKPALVINGHYHRPQVVRVGGIEVVIPGSPASFTTDDPAAGKGYVVAEI